MPLPSEEDEADRLGALNGYLIGLLAMSRRGALFGGTHLEDFLPKGRNTLFEFCSALHRDAEASGHKGREHLLRVSEQVQLALKTAEDL